jgi:hypothetical protein
VEPVYSTINQSPVVACRPAWGLMDSALVLQCGSPTPGLLILAIARIAGSGWLAHVTRNNDDGWGRRESATERGETTWQS